MTVPRLAAHLARLDRDPVKGSHRQLTLLANRCLAA
jgi:hypothetical protein